MDVTKPPRIMPKEDPRPAPPPAQGTPLQMPRVTTADVCPNCGSRAYIDLDRRLQLTFCNAKPWKKKCLTCGALRR